MLFKLFSSLQGHAVLGLNRIYNGILHNSAWGAGQLSVGLEASSDGKCINRLWEKHQVENLFKHMLISTGSEVAIFSSDANMGNYILPTKALDEHYLAEKFQKKGKHKAI